MLPKSLRLPAVGDVGRYRRYARDPGSRKVSRISWFSCNALRHIELAAVRMGGQIRCHRATELEKRLPGARGPMAREPFGIGHGWSGHRVAAIRAGLGGLRHSTCVRRYLAGQARIAGGGDGSRSLKPSSMKAIGKDGPHRR